MDLKQQAADVWETAKLMLKNYVPRVGLPFAGFTVLGGIIGKAYQIIQSNNQKDALDAIANTMTTNELQQQVAGHLGYTSWQSLQDAISGGVSLPDAMGNLIMAGDPAYASRVAEINASVTPTLVGHVAVTANWLGRTQSTFVTDVANPLFADLKAQILQTLPAHAAASASPEAIMAGVLIGAGAAACFVCYKLYDWYKDPPYHAIYFVKEENKKGQEGDIKQRVLSPVGLEKYYGKPAKLREKLKKNDEILVTETGQER